MLGSRMGSEKTREDIMLIHDSNVEELFRYLDRAFTTNKKGDRVFLSDYIKKANSIDQIEQIVDIYNDSWQNYW